MRKYWTSLTENYCLDWTPANAMRELVQNALDSSAPFEYEVEGDTVRLISRGVTLPRKTLLMGESTKRNEESSIGCKGEGYKLAAVILLRRGYPLTIYNGNYIWEPAFEYNEDYETAVLCFNETYNFSNDLIFEISNVDSNLLSEIEHDCLYLREHLGEVKVGERGRVLLDQSGELFVGGLFVCDISSHSYSYDFNPKYLPLNRDRKSVDTWDLARNVTELLQEVLDAEHLATMVEEDKRDAGSYYSSFDSPEVSNILYENLKVEYGDDVVVANSSDEEEKFNKCGIKNVATIYNSNKANLIKKSEKYQEYYDSLIFEEKEVVKDKRSPIEMLEEIYDLASFSWTSSVDGELLGDLICLFKERGVSFDE